MASLTDQEYEENVLRDSVERANANIEKIIAARGKEGAVERVRKMIDGATVVIGVFQDMDEPFGVDIHVIKGQRLMKSAAISAPPERCGCAADHLPLENTSGVLNPPRCLLTAAGRLVPFLVARGGV